MERKRVKKKRKEKERERGKGRERGDVEASRFSNADGQMPRIGLKLTENERKNEKKRKKGKKRKWKENAIRWEM